MASILCLVCCMSSLSLVGTHGLPLRLATRIAPAKGLAEETERKSAADALYTLTRAPTPYGPICQELPIGPTFKLQHISPHALLYWAASSILLFRRLMDQHFQTCAAKVILYIDEVVPRERPDHGRALQGMKP